MADDLQTTEDLLIDLIAAIYASQLIPDDHKEKYVEYLQKNGLTEKMSSELEKVFMEESKQIAMSLEEKKELMKGLEEIVSKEQAEIDYQQAEIVAAVEIHEEQKKEELKGRLDDLGTVMSEAFEELGKESESSEIEKIRAQLAKPKKVA